MTGFGPTGYINSKPIPGSGKRNQDATNQIRDRWKSTSSTTGHTSMMPDNQTNRLDNHLNNNTSESEVTSETVSEGETVREQYQQRIDKINNGN